MAYEPLHHKYRPQTFAELVGQEAIATTLSNALRQQRIAPAYLFTGARGTGKTSSARILAKSLNCLSSDVPTAKPCGVCEVCRSIANGSALDVIEIDAASNTGVDNIRELIERAQFAPVQCRYKVYVIDECHMLSTAAFNALLKTLEEPPDRVVFVLATTDPQRVLPTIISRCQRFDFRRIELAAMVQHLSQIAQQEAIDIAPEAVQLVGQIAQGGLRDAESTLDQLSLLEGQITVERVWDLVGAIPERDLLALVQAIAQNDATGVIDRLRHLMDRGREPLIVLQNLASFYRDLLIAKSTPDRNDLVAVTPPTWAEMSRFGQTLSLSSILAGQQHLRASETQVKNTTQPRLWLEVTLLGLLPASQGSGSVEALPAAPPPRPAAANPVPPPAPPAPVPSVAIPVNIAPVVVPVEPAEPVEPVEPVPAEPSVPAEIPVVLSPSSINLEQMWQSVVEALQPPGTQALFKQQGRLLALEAESARVGISSQPLFKMAQLRVANLESALTIVVQHPVRVSLEVVTTPSTPAPVGTSPSDAPTVPSVPPSRPASKPVVKEGTNGNGADSTGYGAADTMPTAKSPPEPPQTPPSWQEDEVSRAAKSLAQMFNGQIVSGAEVSSTAPAASFENVAEIEAEEGDPDDDVPF